MKIRVTVFLLCLVVLFSSLAGAADGLFVRFQLERSDAADEAWFVTLRGIIHNPPWYLPAVTIPEGADKDVARRLDPGTFSEWFDLGTHAKKELHGRLDRAGGVAELPNVTVQFGDGLKDKKRKLRIELATAPTETAVVKRFEESFVGDLTGFLVSPTLREDADSLETASQGAERRLAWAREASGGRRVAPEKLWIQTQFWSPQRAELNLKEAETLWQMGFNLVGNISEEAVRKKFPFLEPAGHHWVEFGPSLTREEIATQIQTHAAAARATPAPSLFGLSDEIACRPPIGDNVAALKQFHAWLKQRGLSPAALGVNSLDEVVPIESPVVLRERQKANPAAANRVFVWTTRFRQESANQRIKWLTETFHQVAPKSALTTSLVADHPYFGGSGLGMGMDVENTTWGGYPLMLDWFGMARDRVLDVAGIEDWLGLQYMYGPGYTWEGFQLMGFQAAIFRSGSRGTQPVITWITPSDEANLRLKSASALCQGAKHFFYWTYGPTATSTENYWSDLRGAYDGVVHVARQLAGAEHIIAPGRPRSTRVALLYSLSSDLWQPFGYLSMAERRLTYLSLVHDQYLVDMLTETDIESGRLSDYEVLYVADPCIAGATCDKIREWVKAGGSLQGSGAAGTRNEFNEPHTGLSETFGIEAEITVKKQDGRFDVRGGLNDMPWLDQITREGAPDVGVLGMKIAFKPKTASVIGTFADGTPAVALNRFGKGRAIFIATSPGVSYAKDAGFVAKELKEKWPEAQRDFINATVRGAGIPRLVELSHPVVEAGVFESEAGSALVLANFTYQPIPHLQVKIPLKNIPQTVRSTEYGILEFKVEPSSPELQENGYNQVVTFSLALGWSDILVVE